MRTTVRRLAARFAAIGAVLAVAATSMPAAAAGVAAAPAAAVPASALVSASASTAGDPVHPAHAASFESAQVPRGALLALFIDLAATEHTYPPFDPWQPAAPDGTYVQATCWPGMPMVTLQLLYVSPHQINVYLPNGSEPEPWGTCMSSGETEFWIYPAGDPTRVLKGGINTVPLHPGLFGAGGVPRGEHVNVGDGGSRTDMSECGPANRVNCPVSTNTVPAELLFDVTGADGIRCNPYLAGFLSIVLNEVTRDASGNETFGPNVVLQALSVTWSSMGVEQIRVRLPNGLAAAEYKVRVWNFQTGYAAQDLRLGLGVPTTTTTT